jgi:hypothetical protein
VFELIIEDMERSAAKAIEVPASCQPKRMASSAGVGALVGLDGFAGGPVVGIPSTALGASGAAVLGMLNCAYDLRETKH